ncbi:hypothetical protein V8E36_005698 [Tilletia maclaganii]
MSFWPEFSLLPPPRPTWLSSKSPRRAQLPRFATMDQAYEFAKGQVFAQDDPAKRVSLIVVVIYIGFLLLLAASIILRRLLTRNFWIFRVIRRSDGYLIVPHLHNCWSFMAGSFAVSSTAYNIVALYYTYRGWPPTHPNISLLYIWTPLYVGASWMGWAAAVAGTQDLLIPVHLSNRFSWKITFPSWVANTIGLGLPASCALAILLPSKMADTHAERARKLYSEWKAEYRHQTVITEEALIALQQIWFAAIEGSYCLAITALLWSIFAGITLTAYTYFGLRLIRILYRHLKKSQGRSLPLQNALTVSMGVCDEEGQLPITSLANAGEPNSGLYRPTLSAAPSSQVCSWSRHSPQDSTREAVAVGPTTSRIAPQCAAANPVSEVPTTPSKPALKLHGAGSVHRAVLYFAIQAGSISMGWCIMVAVAATVSARIVAQAELGHLQSVCDFAWMTLSYVCVVFGTTTLCSMSIAHLVEMHHEQLPRFSSVDEVIDFAKGQVLAYPDPFASASLFFFIVYVGLLFTVAISIIIRRSIVKRFWLFRTIQRPDGRLVVPHLHNCWTFMCCVFALYATTCNIIILNANYHNQPPPHVCVTFFYTGMPLTIGASWMCWASAIAGTQNFTIAFRFPRAKLRTIRIPSWLANTVGLGSFTSGALVILGCTVAADRYSERARHLYLDFRTVFGDSPSITAEMLVKVQELWYEVIKGSYYVAIAAMLWAIFTSLTLVTYVFFSQRLIRALLQHLHNCRAESRPLQNAMSVSMGLYDGSDQLARRVQPAYLPFSTPQEHGSRSADTFETATESAERPKMTSTAATSPQSAGGASCRASAEQHSVSTSKRRAVIYFAIQAGGINAGLAIRIGVELMTATMQVSETELGRVQRISINAWLALSYVCVCFGTATVFSIAHETFEENITSLLYPHSSSRGTTHLQESSGRGESTISLLERRRRLLGHRAAETCLRPDLEDCHEKRNSTPSEVSIRTDPVLAVRAAFKAEQITPSEPSSGASDASHRLV